MRCSQRQGPNVVYIPPRVAVWGHSECEIDARVTPSGGPMRMSNEVIPSPLVTRTESAACGS